MQDGTRGRSPCNGWWARLLHKIDERFSGPIDDEARRRGWTVTVRPGTRTHVYRDPRWDRRHRCRSAPAPAAQGRDRAPGATARAW
jgi:hypothetical protein